MVLVYTDLATIKSHPNFVYSSTMQDLRVYEVTKGKSFAQAKRKRKDKELIRFRCERINILIFNEDTREFFCFNKFTGSRIPNYRADGKPLVFRPEKYKKETKTGRKVVDEINSIMKDLTEKDLIALAFFDKMDRVPDIKKDFPQVIEAAVQEHKKRFLWTRSDSKK